MELGFKLIVPRGTTLVYTSGGKGCFTTSAYTSRAAAREPRGLGVGAGSNSIVLKPMVQYPMYMWTQRLTLVGLLLLLAVGAGLLVWSSLPNPAHQQPNTPPTGNQPPTNPAVVQVYEPVANALVTSPLVVSGQAPGTWFFEASLPVSLVDETGKELARAPARAQDDWMTTGPVRFSATLTFTPPATATGYLVVENDNPSGNPENSKSFRVKVRFK